MKRIAFLLLVLVAMSGCVCNYGGGGTTTLDLQPPSEPILAVAVGDAIEAALLEQQLRVAPVRLDGTTLYLYDRGDIRARLESLGYEPQRVNGADVAQRVARVSRRGAAPGEEIAQFGVSVINRERDHWVVTGSVAALRGLAGSGYRLDPVRDPEPRPRQVRILARSIEDVGRLGGIVDIYSVEGADRRRYETNDQQGRGVIVYGAAFDSQIDQVRALGMDVEILPPPPRGGKP
jgi:hypothetical protein